MAEPQGPLAPLRKLSRPTRRAYRASTGFFALTLLGMLGLVGPMLDEAEEGSRLARLWQEGTPVEATITDAGQEDSLLVTSFFAEYAYVAGGERRLRRMTVLEEELPELQRGRTIPARIDPADPTRSAIERDFERDQWSWLFTPLAFVLLAGCASLIFSLLLRLRRELRLIRRGISVPFQIAGDQLREIELELGVLQVRTRHRAQLVPVRYELDGRMHEAKVRHPQLMTQGRGLEEQEMLLLVDGENRKKRLLIPKVFLASDPDWMDIARRVARFAEGWLEHLDDETASTRESRQALRHAIKALAGAGSPELAQNALADLDNLLDDHRGLGAAYARWYKLESPNLALADQGALASLRFARTLGAHVRLRRIGVVSALLALCVWLPLYLVGGANAVSPSFPVAAFLMIAAVLAGSSWFLRPETPRYRRARISQEA